MEKLKSGSVIFKDKYWKIVFIAGGLFQLIPLFKCKIKKWEMNGGSYAISLPIIENYGK